ncbi:NnrS family protein [Pseudoduganella sp. UC29_106]|uniref:NnrS family protein n=1 Tax=Pseudoduganella sp. UC29_106 TaxID=3374553 RepID=UPI0037567462
MSSSQLLRIDDPHTTRQPPALLRLAFRPFYLLAAALAAIAVPLWLAGYQGLLPLDLLWHSHEMVFGFAGAVIVGFLLTASRNWTNLWTPRGASLAALALLWIAGRAAMLATGSAAPAIALAARAIDVAFLPAAAWALLRVLLRANSRRNYPVAAILALLSLANITYHAAALGWLAISPLTPVHGAILLVTLLEAVIGGRVIPMFTANGAPGSKPRSLAWRDKAALALIALTALAWLLAAPALLTAALAFAAAAVNAARLYGWAPPSTLRVPLLWVLHLAYAWIAGGLLLLGFAALGLGSASSAFHALAVGAMSGLIIGMVTRTALGHTGRPLKAGRAESFMYYLLEGGAVLRLCANIPGGKRDQLLVISAACWSAAFLLYLIVYTPYLSQPRLDGREG